MFPAELLCLQWIRCSLPNYSVCYESVFPAELCCRQRTMFAAEIVWSTTNQHSLLNLCCLQQINIHCRIFVVCSELVFAAKIVFCAVNQSSLPKLCGLQWTSVRFRNCAVWSEAEFAAEMCCLQRSNIRCQNCFVCSESVFGVGIVLSVAKQRSLPKMCYLQRISVRCWISIVSRESVFTDDSRSLANLFLLTKFCSRFTYLKWRSD